MKPLVSFILRVVALLQGYLFSESANQIELYLIIVQRQSPRGVCKNGSFKKHNEIPGKHA